MKDFLIITAFLVVFAILLGTLFWLLDWASLSHLQLLFWKFLLLFFFSLAGVMISVWFLHRSTIGQPQSLKS